jgi:hypothetical protein
MPLVKGPFPAIGFTNRIVASSTTIGTNELGDKCHLCGLNPKVRFVGGLTGCVIFDTPLLCN